MRSSRQFTKLFPKQDLKNMNSLQLGLELMNAIRNLDDTDNHMVESALQTATHFHRNQTRLYRNDMPKTPYIEHPVRVALRLNRWGLSSPENLTGALLHDVPEDCAPAVVKFWGKDVDPSVDKTEKSLEILGDIYGPQVKEMLTWVTNDPTMTYTDHYQALLDNASDDAIMIKAADTIDNAGSLPHQYGYVPDAMIVKLIKKYLQVMPPLYRELQNRELTIPANHVMKIYDKVSALSGRLINEKVMPSGLYPATTQQYTHPADESPEL